MANPYNSKAKVDARALEAAIRAYQATIGGKGGKQRSKAKTLAARRNARQPRPGRAIAR